MISQLIRELTFKFSIECSLVDKYWVKGLNKSFLLSSTSFKFRDLFLNFILSLLDVYVAYALSGVYMSYIFTIMLKLNYNSPYVYF